MAVLQSLKHLVFGATVLVGTVFATRQEPVLQLHSDDVTTLVANSGMDITSLNASASDFEVHKSNLIFRRVCPRFHHKLFFSASAFAMT